MADAYDWYEGLQTDTAMTLTEYIDSSANNTGVTGRAVVDSTDLRIGSGTAGTSTYTCTIPKDHVGAQFVSMTVPWCSYETDRFYGSFTRGGATGTFRLEVTTGDTNFQCTKIFLVILDSSSAHKRTLINRSYSTGLGTGTHTFDLGVTFDVGVAEGYNWASGDRLQLHMLANNLAAHSSTTISFKMSQQWDVPYQKYGIHWGASSLAGAGAVVALRPPDATHTRIIADATQIEHAEGNLMSVNGPSLVGTSYTGDEGATIVDLNGVGLVGDIHGDTAS